MLVVHDLDSSNGTFINGERIDEPTFLYPGETLRIGKVSFEAEYDAPDIEFEETEIEFVMDDEGEDPQEHDQKQVIDEVDCQVDYEETEQGSFLGISRLDLGADSVEKASASQVVIEDGSAAAAQPVDRSDSVLDRFLKEME